MLSEKKKNRCAADSGSSLYSVFRTAKQILPMQRQSRHFLPRITASVLQMGTVTVPQSPKPLPVHSYHLAAQGKPQSRPARQAVIVNLRAAPHNSRLTAQAPLRRLRHGICVAKMLDNVGLRYPHRASGAKAPRTLRPLPLLRFAVSATGGAHLCSIQYYLRFWLGICRTSLAVSALRIMRYCLKSSHRPPA